MKNRKRQIVYTLLAIPFVILGVFLLTADPSTRVSFFGEFWANAAEQFGLVDEIPAANSGVDSESGGDSGSNSPTGERGRRGGNFDPAEFFAEQDADGDGKLTGDEISERMRENLDRIDADQDGSVTLEEMQNSWGRGRGGNRGRGRGGRRFDPAEFFAEQDADGDGKLTGDEIGERMRENLDTIDVDDDGSISLEELEAGMEQFRGRGGRGGPGGRRGPSENDAREGRPERPQRPE